MEKCSVSSAGIASSKNGLLNLGVDGAVIDYGTKKLKGKS